MSELKQAESLLGIASGELRALRGMTDAEVFSDQLFGFVAQQAIEKCLKAWLCILDEEYPLTHDIDRLLSQLEESGQDVDDLWDLVALTPYAGVLRYTNDLRGYSPLDRVVTTEDVESLLKYVTRTYDDAVN